jgi:hypothetical protein
MFRTARTVSVAPSTAPTATPEPTPGFITFGTSQNPGTLDIGGVTNTFRLGRKIAWTAYSSGPAGTTSLKWIISKQESGGAEHVTWSQTITIGDPQANEFGDVLDLTPFIDGAGHYVMRYYRGSTVLAEGDFTITK